MRHEDEEEKMKIAAILFSLLLTACTISFQNVSTHGKADDVIDDTATPSVDASVTLPVLP